MENIDWSNLELDKKKNLELVMLRKQSYYRYDPPNMYMMYWFFGLLSFGMAGVFFFFRANVPDFPHPDRIHVFWGVQSVLIAIGLFLLYLYFPAKKKSDQRWEEMEGIRKQIDDELKRRDELLGLGEK